jgi:SAM-dependent methyltransferase
MLKESWHIPAPEGATASTPDLWAENFRSARPLTDRRRRTLERERCYKLIQRYIPRGGSVLDAGCGAGEWAAFLREKGYRVTGLDYSAELVARLREMYPAGDWLQGSILELPVPDASFDGIISWGAIEHDEDGPETALREFARVLRPGGRMIVTVPVHDRWAEGASRHLIRLLEHQNGADRSHTREVFFQYYMTEAELSDFVSATPLRVIETGRLGPALLGKGLPRLYHATKSQRIVSALLHRAFAAMFFWNVAWYHMIYCVAERPSA